jgi:hypothetical protein
MKLAPLSLLIPAVVLAQPTYQAPTPPQVSIPQNPTINPTEDAKAAIAIKAFSDAKKKSSSGVTVKGGVNDEDEGRYKYKVYSETNGMVYSCENKDSYSTKTCTPAY